VSVVPLFYQPFPVPPLSVASKSSFFYFSSLPPQLFERGIWCCSVLASGFSNLKYTTVLNLTPPPFPFTLRNGPQISTSPIQQARTLSFQDPAPSSRTQRALPPSFSLCFVPFYPPPPPSFFLGGVVCLVLFFLSISTGLPNISLSFLRNLFGDLGVFSLPSNLSRIVDLPTSSSAESTPALIPVSLKSRAASVVCPFPRAYRETSVPYRVVSSSDRLQTIHRFSVPKDAQAKLLMFGDSTPLVPFRRTVVAECAQKPHFPMIPFPFRVGTAF